MKRLFFLLFSFAVLSAQGQRRSDDITASPLPVGDAGIMWYTTWESALAEAKRSNRPIFFMSAAATCNGVPGVF